MWFLLSGEGPTDIGTCTMPVDYCELPEFRVGPMACIVDKLVQKQHEYSPIEYRAIRFIPEQNLSRSGKSLRKNRAPSLPGRKKPKETQYFERNARALAVAAKELAEDKNDTVIAVLFRDSDGTRSQGRGEWEDKRNSMKRGFEIEAFATGVPMIPKPKSEAWLLCAVKNPPYQHCANLENESGNDTAPNPLKRQLDNATGKHLGQEDWFERIYNGAVDLNRIDMPSFNDFKQNFTAAINTL
ncbi:hypothetical protein [endosymbiont of Lamellibrachia barhami]|uniref:hypothetical protein n=1 Tax=endosymbiont of Lamellibrachia barhami TaxID=205975 RepID=UPI0015AB57CE|nr:hypothetical protein [endosymbiont of Lamellibrachia barhami]